LRVSSLALLASCVLASVPQAQAPTPQLVIVSPTADDVLSGVMTFQAATFLIFLLAPLGRRLIKHETARLEDLWLLPINGLLVAGEVWGHHATEDARRAARLIQEDVRFSSGVLAIGHLLPLALLWSGQGVLFAGGLTLAGLLMWEHLYVQAPQQVALA